MEINKSLTKELAPIKAQISKTVMSVSALKVEKEEDLARATDALVKIKVVGRKIKEKKEEMTKPLNLALKNIRDFFRPVESDFAMAEKIVKDKIITYQNKAEKEASKKTEKIVEKVEEGKISFDKAADKIEAITPDKTVETGTGSVQFRKIKEVRITDEAKIPREYLVPNMVKIKKVALAGVSISGVEVVEKRVVAGIIK